MPARSRAAWARERNGRHFRTRASLFEDRVRPHRLERQRGLQLRRRADGPAGKTSVTRELPVGEAVKLRQLSLIPCGTSGQLFSSRCQRQYRQGVRDAAAKLDLLSTSDSAGRNRRMARLSRTARGRGGARRDRTDDLLLAKQALSQLSYGPTCGPPPVRPQTRSRTNKVKE